MKIRAQLRCMSESEIRDMIPPETLREIKRKDPAPLFKAFVIGHEGEAEGVLVGVGNIVKRWFRDAVEKLHSKVRAGVQLFNGHAETNSHDGRISIGEVAGKKLMRVKDRLSSVVACWIYPEFKHLPLDVASIEASVDLDNDRRGGLYVADVGELTGIALSNSAIERPGFPGATLLGQLQAFAKSKNIRGDNSMDFTIEDVKTFLKAEKIQPSDLFGAERLAEDPAVKGLVESETRRAVAGEYAHRKRTEEGFDKTREELEKQLKDKDAELDRLKVESAKAKVVPLFDKQKADRKLDEKQIKFIQARLERFVPKSAEEVEKDFNAYLDSEVDEYGRLAKEVFGIEPAKENGNGSSKDSGTGPDEGKPAGPAVSKYLDPAQNPFIKTA